MSESFKKQRVMGETDVAGRIEILRRSDSLRTKFRKEDNVSWKAGVAVSWV